MQTDNRRGDGGPWAESPAWSPGRDRGGGGSDPDRWARSSCWPGTTRPVAQPAPNATDIETDQQRSGTKTRLFAPGAYFVDTDGDEATSLGGTFVIEGERMDDVPSGARERMVGGVCLAPGPRGRRGVVTGVCEPPLPHRRPPGRRRRIWPTSSPANGFTVREALAPVSAFGHDGLPPADRDVPESVRRRDAHRPGRAPSLSERYYQANGQMVEYWFLDVEGHPGHGRSELVPRVVTARRT